MTNETSANDNTPATTTPDTSEQKPANQGTRRARKHTNAGGPSGNTTTWVQQNLASRHQDAANDTGKTAISEANHASVVAAAPATPTGSQRTSAFANPGSTHVRRRIVNRRNPGPPSSDIRPATPGAGGIHTPSSSNGRTQPPHPEPAVNLGDYGAKTDTELLEIALQQNISTSELPNNRNDLILLLLQNKAEETNTLIGAGILEILTEGYGFLRPLKGNGANTHLDEIHVPRSVIARYRLRKYDEIVGPLNAPKRAAKYYSLRQPEIINGRSPAFATTRPNFEKLTPVYPNHLINLETTPEILATRIIDIVAPIGRGQRALIVAPPKAGKTIILKQIANAITKNHPSLKIILTLIGERPEEVTDMHRSIEGEAYSSTFDEPAERHCRTAEKALERARRLVEQGEHVALLLDSVTRLARAYNVAAPSSGKTLSGGMDPVALYPPKMFFGAARNVEEGGSLTIIATALVETGSRLDDLIYEEFKGTGNMEVLLSRRMADRRIFPAVDIKKSGTRHEELLLPPDTLKQVWLLRRMLALLEQSAPDSTESAERIIERLSKTRTNAEFLLNIGQPE